MVTTLAQPQLPARVNRSPKHPFMLSHKPWVLQPFICAPVLPGETMTNLLLQSRCVTDPINNPLAGWWLEYYIFYVKLSDLAIRDALITMLIDPDNADVSGYRQAAHSYPWYTAEGGINWPSRCMERCVDEYFRNEGQTYTTGQLNGMPLIAVADDKATWMQSLVMGDTLDALDIALTVGVDDSFTMSELETARREYELLKAHGLQKMSWEDYLKSAGVRTSAAVEAHKPELLRYIREWSYPTNTIDPTNGTPRSAVSWAIAERADKARAFTEPGFIFGMTVARPKIFFRNQKGLAAGFMQTAAAWLPPQLQDDAWSSITKHITASDSGPLPNIVDAQGYAWDMRDLLLYGEQFINFDATSSTGKNLVNLPSTTADRDYVSETDVDGLFVSGSADQIRQDGIVHLTIKGRQRDTTPPPSRPLV